MGVVGQRGVRENPDRPRTEVLRFQERTPLGPYRRSMPRVLGSSHGGGRFLMGKVPPYQETLAADDRRTNSTRTENTTGKNTW